MPEQILIWTCVAVFVVTALITLLGIIEEPKIVVIKDKWLKPLYVALILEVVSVGVLVFKGYITIPGAEASVSSNTEVSFPDHIKNLKDEKNISDFFRMFFLSRGTSFSGSLGRPDADRVFVAPAKVFTKPMALGTAAKYLGNDYREIEDVYLLKCNPHDTRILDARLATWPNVFDLIAEKVQMSEADCKTNSPKSSEEQASCIAGKYSATRAGTDAHDSLAYMFKGATELYDKKLGGLLKKEYGITKNSFIGTGHIVSGTGAGRRLDINDLLIDANVPEYLVKNVSISTASCKCIVVTPYNKRQDQEFSISVFSKIKEIGKCHKMEQLPKI